MDTPRPPLTLADLRSHEVLDAGHAQPARLAVIGHPVKHSASPRMHQPALDEAGIGARYVMLDLHPGEVAEAFQRMRELGFVGTNVTVPHKLEALEACDEIDETAQAFGAVNTVSFTPGAIRGTNTDGYGFEQAVRESFQLELAGHDVLIAGAGGGAGGAIATHCARAGARRIVLANRTLSKLDPLVEKLAPHAAEITCAALGDPRLAELAHGCQLLVNTSSLGLRPEDPSPLEAACFLASHAVFDSIYQPPNTAFLQLARAAGARTAGGFGMLLHQGVRSFQIWFPGSHPEAAMRRGLESAR